jgi:hypothetical protein
MLLDVRPGRPDHVYLSDFGLSKGVMSSAGLTALGEFLGTPDYVAPEQIEGKSVDGRADQYALACAAFELLAGQPPFRRDEATAVIWSHLSVPPPPLTELRPDLPTGTNDVLARAMAKAPGDRYEGCGDFAEALRQALGLPAYSPGPVSIPVRAPEQPTAGHPAARVIGPDEPAATQGDVTATSVEADAAVTNDAVSLAPGSGGMLAGEGAATTDGGAAGHLGPGFGDGEDAARVGAPSAPLEQPEAIPADPALTVTLLPTGSAGATAAAEPRPAGPSPPSEQPTHTPAAPSPPASPPAARPRRNRRLPVLAGLVAVITVSAVTLVLIASSRGQTPGHTGQAGQPSATTSGTATATPVSQGLSLTSLLGTWENTDSSTRGTVKFILSQSNGGLTVHGFGACSPTPCDWGPVPGVSYAADVQSTSAVAFTAKYNFGFSDDIVAGYLSGNTLTVGHFTRFTDNSGRPNIASIETFVPSG